MISIIVENIQNHIYLYSTAVITIAILIKHRKFRLYRKSTDFITILKKEIKHFMLISIALALLFGAAISISVAFGNGDQAWWIMPLILGPISYITTVMPLMLPVWVFIIFVIYKTRFNSSNL